MAFRLHIRTLKSLSWLAVVLALGWAGFTFWDIYEGKQKEGRYQPRPMSAFLDILASETDAARDLRDTRLTYPRTRQETMWSARLDGSLPPKPKQPGEGDKPKDTGPPKIVVPPLDTLVKVSAVVWSGDPLLRFVALEYTDAAQEPTRFQKSKRLYVTQGEPLRPPYDEEPYGGKLLSIERQAVTFAWGGEEVVLTPDLGLDGSGVTADQFAIDPRADPLAALDSVPQETTRLPDGSYVIGLDDMDTFRTRGPQIVESLTLRTVTPQGGGSSSLELVDLPEDSILKSYGFSAGDRIISVNGIPMSSKSQAWNWYEQNPDLPTYTIKYQSKGQEKTTTIHNPDAN